MRRPVTIKDMENMSDLYNKGYTINYIAGRLGFAHPTVKKYVAKPTTKKTTRVGSISKTFTAPTTDNKVEFFVTPTQKDVTGTQLVEAIKLIRSFGFKVEI